MKYKFIFSLALLFNFTIVSSQQYGNIEYDSYNSLTVGYVTWWKVETGSSDSGNFTHLGYYDDPVYNCGLSKMALFSHDTGSDKPDVLLAETASEASINGVFNNKPLLTSVAVAPSTFYWVAYKGSISCYTGKKNGPNWPYSVKYKSSTYGSSWPTTTGLSTTSAGNHTLYAIANNTLPLDTFFVALNDLCIEDGIQTGLSGGNPDGGVYSGPGVTDNGDGINYSFDPAIAGAGVHTLTYTIGGNAYNDNVEVTVCNSTTPKVIVNGLLQIDSFSNEGSYTILTVDANGVVGNIPNTDDNDPDPLNEIQDISLVGNDLSISNGSTLTLPVGADDLGNHTATTTLNMDDNPIENVSTPVNDMDAANKAYVDLDMDTDPLNEIQTFTASTEGDTLYLSGSNWLIIPGLSDANYIKDFDGNVYTEVVIGSKTWLKENMRAVHYNDGSPIPKIETDTDWDDWNASWDGSEYTDLYDAYCWFDNDSTTYSKFGALYNWGVVDTTINGGKNVCPIGYVVPSTADISALIVAAGGNQAGLELKYPPGEWWQTSQNFPFGGNGTNESGFSAVGTGERANNGPYSYNKQRGWIWSTTGGSTDNVNALRILYDDWETTTYTNQSGSEGFSIRCIKTE